MGTQQTPAIEPWPDGSVGRCPICDAPLADDDVNMREGVARCPECRKLVELSQISRTDRSVRDIVEEPPADCVVFESGRGVTVRASLRSFTHAGAMLALAAFWNCLLSIFVAQALASVIHNVTGSLPTWFWAPDVKNGVPHMNGQPMGVGATIGVCVFLLPFVAIGVGMLVAVAMRVGGRLDVVLDETASFVTTGIGPLAWRRRFDPRATDRVGVSRTWRFRDESDPHTHVDLIELRADRRLRFGRLLTEAQSLWMRTVLRALLLDADRHRHQPYLPTIDWIRPVRRSHHR